MLAATHATPADLAAAGLVGINGTGVTVGVLEAGNGIPFAANLFLPAGAISNVPQGGREADIITNHATEVTGVIVSQGAIYRGMAPGSSIEAAGTRFVPEMILNGQDMATMAFGARATIINMSFGFNFHPTNGMSLETLWVDYAAVTVPGALPNSPIPQDILFVIAGNEGTKGRPSDLFNGINVAATGRRDDGTITGTLVYDQEAWYNTSNITTDRSPITRLGRVKTDIIAPGGDAGIGPGGTFGGVGTIAAPPASVNQFVTTGAAGATVAGAAAAGWSERLFGPNQVANLNFQNLTGIPNSQGRPAYRIDDFDNLGFTNDYFWASDSVIPMFGAAPYPSPAAYGPGTNLQGNDGIVATTFAGTSFAAPLVSGAASLLTQYGSANALSTDHRVLKANLLNGASKRTPTGANTLTDQTGAQWGLAVKATDGFTKPNNIGGGFVPLQVGIDPFLGTGQLDVAASGNNYRAGEWNPGVVPNIGWDIHQVTSLNINSYVFPALGFEHFSATLAWDRFVALENHAGDPDIWDDLADTFVATPLSDLDLALYFLDPILGAQLIEFSTSDIDSVEHIFTPLNAPGLYRLDVLNQSIRDEDYGLAWRLLDRDPDYYNLISKYRAAVPEPATTGMILVAVVGLASHIRRRPAA
jgi:hypothetical protein